MSIRFHEFGNFTELSNALCQQWLQLIQQAAGSTSFALAGGSTPAPIYRQLDQLLQQQALSHPLKLVATDERWVPDADVQSNEGLFRRCFEHSSKQAGWQLISLKNSARTPEIAAEAIHQRLQTALPQAFTAVLLGMGTDGHIASLFPGAPTRHDDLDCLAAVHPDTRQCRMSLSLPRLQNSQRIWLVISGEAKRQVLNHAIQKNLPVAQLLKQNADQLEVFWCP